MKRFLPMLLALCLLCGSALALTAAERDALVKPYLPADAAFAREERDDGLLELTYRTADSLAEYKIKLDENDQIVQISYELRDDRGGASEALTQEQAFAVVAAAHPSATLTSARVERDDGRYEYKVLFTSPEWDGEYTLNAADGTVLKYELYPATLGESDAAAAILTAKYPGATVQSVKTDTEDGRKQYEGKASYQDRVYEFAIDVESGKIVEWEID